MKPRAKKGLRSLLTRNRSTFNYLCSSVANHVLLSPAGWVKTLAFRRRLQRCVAVEWAHGRVPSWGAQRIRDPSAPGLGDEVSQAGAGGSDRSTSPGSDP